MRPKMIEGNGKQREDTDEKRMLGPTKAPETGAALQEGYGG